MSQRRDAEGKFKAVRQTFVPGEGQISEHHFRNDALAVKEWSDFLDSETGIKLRRVLSCRRAMMLKAVSIKPDEAVAQLAKLQAFEEIAQLLIELLPTAIDRSPLPMSRKAGAVTFDRQNIAPMP